MLLALATILMVQAKKIEPPAAFAMAFSPNAETRRQGFEALSSIDWKPEFKKTAWDAYRKSAMHAALGKEFTERQIRTDDRTAPFKWRVVGTEVPGQPMPLVIALHGGGSGPKEMNDSQWEGMFSKYYNDAPARAPYVYCALRAPNDEWNGFYDDSIAQVIERLILAFELFGNVDASRVVVTGASHGGYGVFVIAPKIPHRFAAANASSGAPTDGETEGENLRNLYFTTVNGALDTAYGRFDRMKAFSAKRKEWQAEDGGFPGGIAILEGVGHFVPDRDKPDELLQQKRATAPEKLFWTQTDDRVKTHYYLCDPSPKPGKKIRVERIGQSVAIVNRDGGTLILYPPPGWVQNEFVVIWGKSSTAFHPQPSCAAYAESLALYGDPAFATPFKIKVENSGQ
ncbi:MAG: hypothetical protein JSS71_07095 [Armatimonadetes bacterium]|nr:hypothetical protein [Armatimonadota bacterium]MBX3107604.1 hypothetical protein [Fimbriimonadaceae bacterium]